jgi:hypothetical protein
MPANLGDDPTSRYLAENRRVLSLERHVHGGLNVRYWPSSAHWLILYKFQQYRFARKQYRHEKRVGARWLEALRGLEGSKAGRSALMIGNGPSQGYITGPILSRFLASGGEAFAVNYWQENATLSQVAPSYLVISDPFTLKKPAQGDPISPKNLALHDYLMEHDHTKIVCPVARCDEIASQFGDERVVGFIDAELRWSSKSISPLKPRGYLSMTLYKALAMAIHLGYSKIFIIGMDNTYPRDIYCDENNRILRRETHAGADDWLLDVGGCYGGMGDLLVTISHLFYDLKKFRPATSEILNLDPYSLTDAFPKAPTIEVERSLLPEAGPPAT